MTTAPQSSAFFAKIQRDEKAAIQSAKADLSQRAKVVTEDFLIAELRFGFWTSLLDARYDKLWHKIVIDVFPHMPKTMRTRGDASKLMHTVRRLRNAALHHHSIWHWGDLQQQHLQMNLLISYICDSVAKMAKQMDRFPSVYSGGFKQFASAAANISN